MPKLLTATFLILVVYLFCPTKAYSQSGWVPAIAAFNPGACTQYGIAPDNSTCATAADTCQMWSNLYSSPYTTLTPGPDAEHAVCGYSYIGTPYTVAIWLGLSCPSPEQPDPNTYGGCAPSPQPGKSRGASSDCGCISPTGSASAGEPIDIGSGNVFYRAEDYSTHGANPLKFVRYYNSRSSAYDELGSNWTSTFDRFVLTGGQTNPSMVLVVRPDGQTFTFTLSGSIWVTDTDVDYTLTQSGSTWTLRTPDDTVEVYTIPGGFSTPYLQSITERNGYTQTLTYSGTNILLLQRVNDSYGRSLNFTYNSNATLATVSTPDSTTLSYGYTSGSSIQLTSVTYPTSPARSVTYGYGTGSTPPNALVSVTDEAGNLYQSWTYDSYGRGLTSAQGGPINADFTTITYDDTNGSRTVANALGVTDTYSFTTLQGVPKVTGISRAATSTTPAATRSFTYDGNGYLASMTDWDGNLTKYTNNAHGLPTQVEEAYGSTVARTTTIAYDATWVHLPHSITTPGLTVTASYDGSGQLLTRTYSDTTTTTAPYSTEGQSRLWTYTWSNALLASVKTPRNFTTTLGYDASGAITSVTDALGHATRITSHTGGGLPLTMVDPNNVTTTFTYSPRQWLLSSSVATSTGARTTSYTYDAAGNRIRTTLPDGSYIATTFDAAHRIVKNTDALGNYVTYILDALGDRTSAKAFTAAGTLSWQHSGSFDALGRLLVDTAGAGQATTYSYDKDSNALTVKDGLGHTTTRTFDALNRLHQSTDAKGGIVAYAYNAHDKLTSVTDPNRNATTWVRDGFNEAIEQASPDSGITFYHFDGDGNLTQKVDAAGVITNQTFDAADRLLTTVYPSDSTLNVSYSYDQAGHGDGIGRLTSLTDASGSLARSYDERGNLLNELRSKGTARMATAYSYDAASRIASITYPSGTLVKRTRDAAGNVTNLAVTAPGATSSLNLASKVTYAPFGPMTLISAFNGVTTAYTLDQDYRITGLGDLTNAAIAWDNANNVSSITDWGTPNVNQTFGYDAVNRLTSANAPYGYGSQSWNYDANGNISGSGYTYAKGTNRLTGVTWTDPTNGPQNQTITYTPTGNVSSIALNSNTYPIFTGTYNAANRLSYTTASGPAATLTYDFKGQRITKANPSSPSTFFSYDQDSTLLEENFNGGYADYIYLNGRLIGTEQNKGSVNSLYYVSTNYLGTPIVATDGSKNIVWGSNLMPYGVDNGTGGSVTQSLRFPGQYLDSAYGFLYNINRDYYTAWGRYLQPDPIGLRGGMNPYSYAASSPAGRTDRLGFIAMAGTYSASVSGSVDAAAADVGSLSMGTVGVAIGAFMYSSPAGETSEELEDIRNMNAGNVSPANYPPGYWNGEQGAAEWGIRNGVGAKEGRKRFHDLKKKCKGSGAKENMGVNPETGEVIDSNGEDAGSLESTNPPK